MASGEARGGLGRNPPPFSNSSGTQSLQQVVVFEGENDNHNYGEGAAARH